VDAPAVPAVYTAGVSAPDFRVIVGGEAHAGVIGTITPIVRDVMIDWDSETWGGGVTYAADVSWLGDKQSERQADDEG